MIDIIVGLNNNILTATLNTTAKTLAINNMTPAELGLSSMVSVWDSTVSAYFPAPVSIAQSTASGIDVYTFTFPSVPAGAANGDTLVIKLRVQDNIANYLIQQKIAGATV